MNALLLQNEAMTGQFTFGPVFSNITFAALEDSGWVGATEHTH